jgi:hypothetical protein
MPRRKGTRWDQVLFVLAAYRADRASSEWRLHRHWFWADGARDLLAADEALAEISCPQEALFIQLAERWRDLFNVSFDLLLPMT